MEKNIIIQQTRFFSFLKEPGLKNLKNHHHELFDNRANKNKAINILIFWSI